MIRCGWIILISLLELSTEVSSEDFGGKVGPFVEAVTGCSVKGSGGVTGVVSSVGGSVAVSGVVVSPGISSVAVVVIGVVV